MKAWRIAESEPDLTEPELDLTGLSVNVNKHKTSGNRLVSLQMFRLHLLLLLPVFVSVTDEKWFIFNEAFTYILQFPSVVWMDTDKKKILHRMLSYEELQGLQRLCKEKVGQA